MAKSGVDFAQSVLENAHISIVFLGHLSFLPACAAILDFKNGHGSSLGFSIGVGDLYLLYLCQRWAMGGSELNKTGTLPPHKLAYNQLKPNFMSRHACLDIKSRV